MPRSIWKGSVSFGLVSIPVKLYGATEDKDISFRQVHSTDGGRIRYQRVCEKCGEVVQFADIAKGYEAADGRLAILTDEDFENLPLSTLKSVDVVQFVDEHEVDPTFFQRTYFLEAEAAGQKPYVLLREALAKENKVAVVKVALRSRESLALIRAQGDLLLMHTMYWPDELRNGEFAAPSQEVKISDAEIEMAKLLIAQLEGEFDPEAYTDSYRAALLEVVEAKLAGAELPEQTDRSAPTGDVIDLMSALKASVEAAKKRREEASSSKAG
ncbi:Ku protein [Tessaracoccus sp. MC1865]|uniref:non-homologous end joining protein Ku n=1 Tax=Tessaracoccus sp. MC1865 TaxID=2760310 RepID=UPI0016011841|nr:Ku protein [Tessaracoccus sp. MC1865]MBB1483351.1 Ku protein [Tessaracoccus sp. MC1865]QTO36467.1 Ku protein [Tessaracoccus sp. MC1865]